MAVRVRTDFSGGNACAVETASGAAGDVVRFAASPHGGTEALWFSLSVEGCARRPVDLVLTNLDSCLGDPLQWEKVWPVVRHGRAQWHRLSAPEVVVLDDGRREARWRVVPNCGGFEFAFCYPYGLEEVAALPAATGEYWRLDSIGVSGNGRPLPRLSNGVGEEGSPVPGIYLMARQHAGETPGSWVLDGLLSRASETVSAVDLLVWAAPLANLDGVMEGDYGKDPFPYDLNRAWTVPPMRHEVLVLQRDVSRWARRCRPVAVIDLHAPSATETEGAYFFIPRASRPPESVAAARGLLEEILPHLPPDLVSQDPVHQPTYASRWSDDGTVGAWAWDRLAIPCLSMETPYGASRGVSLTPIEYRWLGAALMDGLAALTAASACG